MATRPWPAVNTVRVAFEGLTAKSVPWANVFWTATSISGSASGADLAIVASNLHALFNTHLWTLQGNDATLERTVCNFYSAEPDQLVADSLSSHAGGSDNPTEVDSLAAVISWQFPQTWRGGKPRTYMAALPTEAFEDSNTLADDYVTALIAGANAFRLGINGCAHGSFEDLALGVQSFFSGNAPRAEGVFYGYTGETVHPRIDSMRRRLGRERT